MAELSINIQGTGSRSALAEILKQVSDAVGNHPEISLEFKGEVSNHTGLDTRVKLESLLGERSHRNARKAVTVLSQNAGIVWVSQVLAMTEDEVMAVHYFGNQLMPQLKKLLKDAGYSWPS